MKHIRTVAPLLVALALILAPVAAQADDITVVFDVTGGALSWVTPPQASITLPQVFGAATGAWQTLTPVVVRDLTGTLAHAHTLTLAVTGLPAGGHILAGTGATTGTCQKVDLSGVCISSGAFAKYLSPAIKEVNGTPSNYVGFSVGTAPEAAVYTYNGMGIVSASPALPVGSSNGGVLSLVLVSGPPA